MADWEAEHLVAAFRFELNKVRHRHVCEQVTELLNYVDHDLARRVAEGVGVSSPANPARENHGSSSPALSQANTHLDTRMAGRWRCLRFDGCSGEESSCAGRGSGPYRSASTSWWNSTRAVVSYLSAKNTSRLVSLRDQGLQDRLADAALLPQRESFDPFTRWAVTTARFLGKRPNFPPIRADSKLALLNFAFVLYRGQIGAGVAEPTALD